MMYLMFAGKPNLTLPLVSYDQVTKSTTQLSPIEQVQSLSPTHTSSSLGSSQVLSPSRARSKSPLSPPPIEGFNWPDVRELRSKYVRSDGNQRLPPVERSHSVPERMLDGGPKRRSSCSSSFILSDGGSVGVPRYRPHLSRDPHLEDRCARLHRAKSLDQRSSGLHLSELQKLKDNIPNDSYNGCYISAEASLPNDNSRKIIVVEKLPKSEAEPVDMAKEAKEEEEDDNYVQIRSPTSREKISIMAVIDRCRAYQESDEYKQREEAGAKTEAVLSGERGKEIDKGTASSNEQPDGAQKTNTTSGKMTDASQQSIVKNLREKFQNLR